MPKKEIIEKTAEELKRLPEITPPEWHKFVKTGISRDRPPVREDWWYVRASAILNKIINHGPLGVSKLRNYYGGKKRRGHKPPHYYKGSGNIIRKILQQLEKAGLAKQTEAKNHKGRIATPKAKSLIGKLSNGLAKK